MISLNGSPDISSISASGIPDSYFIWGFVVNYSVLQGPNFLTHLLFLAVFSIDLCIKKNKSGIPYHGTEGPSLHP